MVAGGSSAEVHRGRVRVRLHNAVYRAESLLAENTAMGDVPLPEGHA